MTLREASEPNRRSVSLFLLVVAIIAVAVAANWLQNRQTVLASNAQLHVISGQAVVSRSDAGNQPLTAGHAPVTMQTADGLETAAESTALIACGEPVRVEIAPDCALSILELSMGGVPRKISLGLALERGTIALRTAETLLGEATIRVETRIASVTQIAGVVSCRCDGDQMLRVSVHEGQATVTMGDQSIQLSAGQETEARLGQTLATQPLTDPAPQPLEVPQTQSGLSAASVDDDPAATPDQLFEQSDKPAASSDGTGIHTVRQGETLYSIAREHGVDWEAIWEANKEQLPRPDLIKVDQRLVIPES